MGQYGLWGTKLTKEKPRFRRGRSLSGGPGGSEVVEDAVALVCHLVGQVNVGVRGELVIRMAEDLLADDPDSKRLIRGSKSVFDEFNPLILKRVNRPSPACFHP